MWLLRAIDFLFDLVGLVFGVRCYAYVCVWASLPCVPSVLCVQWTCANSASYRWIWHSRLGGRGWFDWLQMILAIWRRWYWHHDDHGFQRYHKKVSESCSLPEHRTKNLWRLPHCKLCERKFVQYFSGELYRSSSLWAKNNTHLNIMFIHQYEKTLITWLLAKTTTIFFFFLPKSRLIFSTVNKTIKGGGVRLCRVWICGEWERKSAFVCIQNSKYPVVAAFNSQLWFGKAFSTTTTEDTNSILTSGFWIEGERIII